MAPSFDCAVSSLLCAEDNAIFGDDDELGSALLDDSDETWSDHHRNHRSHYNIDHHRHKNRSFVVGESSAMAILPLLQSDEVLASMAERESHHLPASDYLKRLVNGDLDLVARNQAVDWIFKANAHFGFGPLCSYLSINYLDRFLSAYELPKGKSWTMQLLAVACLSLAAKMEETEVPLSLDLQVGDSKFVFEARTIQRMELLVLSTLKWRMQSVTPFNFIDHYLHKMFNEFDDDQDQDQDQIIPVNRASILRSTQLILSIVKGIDFLEFRPSELAAAVAISVASETKTVDTQNPIPLLIQQHLEKERVVKCVEMIKDTIMSNIGSVGLVQSMPQSPIGVLDATSCLSYRSNDTSTVGSCAISSSSSSSSNTDNKRRKLNRPFEVLEL